VNGAIGQSASIILWETKHTKAWSDGGSPKLRDDQRRSSADVTLIISHALPKHIEQFDLVDVYGWLIRVAHCRSLWRSAQAIGRNKIATELRNRTDVGSLCRRR
jgi:hypothetical protein